MINCATFVAQFILKENYSTIMLNSIKKDAIWLFALQIFQIVFGLFNGILIARILGPHDRGILALFGTIILLSTNFLDGGLSSSNIFFLGKRKATLSVIHSNSFVWTVGVGLLIVAASFIVNDSFITWLTPNFPVIYMYIALLIIPLSLYIYQWGGIMTGLGKIRVSRQFGVLNQFVALSFSIVSLLIIGWSLASLVWFAAIYNLISVFIAFAILRQVSGSSLRFQFESKVLRESANYGLKIYLGLLVQLIHLKLDILMLEYFLGPEQVGQYSVAVSLAEALLYVETAITGAGIFKIVSQHEVDSRVLACRLTRHLSFLMIGAGIFLALLSGPIVEFAYGQQYAPAIQPLRFLILGVLALGVVRPLTTYIAYQRGRPDLTLVVSAIALMLNPLLNLHLIPLYGINGAALASTLSYLFLFALVIMVFFRFSKSTFNETFFVTRHDLYVYVNLFKRGYNIVKNWRSNSSR